MLTLLGTDLIVSKTRLILIGKLFRKGKTVMGKKPNLMKNMLLAGTALVAVNSVILPVQAADLVLGGNSIWAGAGGQDSLNIGNAAIGDNVDIGTFDLSFRNNGVASDGTVTGGGFGGFSTGDVTGTTGNIDLLVMQNGASLYVDMQSLDITGGGNVLVTNQDATDSVHTQLVVLGDANIGGTLTVTNTETNVGGFTNYVSLGNLNVTGTTDVTAGAYTNAESKIRVDGDATFGGQVTMTGGAGAAATATLFLNGGSVTAFNGGLDLATAGKSILRVAGTEDQTISGNISGAGDIIIENVSTGLGSVGTAFTGMVGAGAGTITIDTSGTGDSKATFYDDINVSSITLGGAGTGTNTFRFVTSGQGLFDAISGTLDGTAGETDIVLISGGHRVVHFDDWGGVTGELNTINISGDGTTLQSQADVTVGTVNVYDASTFTIANNSTTAVTGNINIFNNGTVRVVSSPATIVGDVGGATANGTFDIDVSAIVSGSVGGLQSVEIAAGQSLEIGGAQFGAITTTLEGTGATLTLSDNGLTSTNIVTAVDGTGDVIIQDGGGTRLFSGDIGTETARLATFDIQGAAANQFATTGNLYVNAITLDNNDFLAFTSTGGEQVVSGTITGGTLSVGTPTELADVTFNGAINMADAAVISSATFNADATFTNNYSQSASGSTAIAAGATLTADAIVNVAGGAYVLGVNDADQTLTTADVGQIVDSSNGSTINRADISYVITGAVGNGTIQGLTGVNLDADGEIANNSVKTTITAANNGNNVDVTFASVTNASLATENNSGVAAALDALAGSADPQIQILQSQLAGAATQEELNDVLEASSSPNLDGGAVVAGLAIASQTASLNEDRLASLRDGTGTGVSAGDAASKGLRFWGQGFGAVADQDDRDGVSGYRVNSFGAAFGVDTEKLSENAVVGLAASYARTDVSSDGLANAQTDIDSYQLALYGSYDFNNNAYVTGQANYIWSRNETSRHPGGAPALTAKGDFDSSQFGARAEAGYDFKRGSMTITPSALVNYVHYTAEDYTETGAGGANLSVNSDDVNLLEVGARVNVAWDIQNRDGSRLQPSLRAGVRHDLIGDEIQATNSFQAGGPSFSANGMDPAQTTFDAGASIAYVTPNNWTLSARYGVEAKADYLSHGAGVKASYKF